MVVVVVVVREGVWNSGLEIGDEVVGVSEHPFGKPHFLQFR